MLVEGWSGNDLGRNGGGLIEVLSRHMPGVTEEIHEHLLKEAVTQPRFESNTSRVQV
jgi:hypothetical protein